MPKKSQGFPLTGKAKNSQFSAGSGGRREVGFKQKTAKQVTAAMMGGPMPSGATKSSKPARRDATKQFGSAPGKKVF
jgi:hypothetical protein